MFGRWSWREPTKSPQAISGSTEVISCPALLRPGAHGRQWSGEFRPSKGGTYCAARCSSVAGLLVTTEAMVAEKPKPKAPAMPPGGMGGMGDMDY